MLLLNSKTTDLSGLALCSELLRGRLRHALLCHVQQRWFLGELFCHSSWISSLAKAGITVSICTNRHYLDLFKNHPAIKETYSPDELTDELLAKHDLIIFTSTYQPTFYHPSVPLAIYSWNAGMAVVRNGRVEQAFSTADINVFVSTCHQQGQTALPNGEYMKLWITDEERKEAAETLKQVLGEIKAPITILNPSSSSPRTRESNPSKIINNNLDLGDCEILIEHLLSEFPGHHIVIGAPIKPGDHENHQLVSVLAGQFSSERRVSSLIAGISVERGLLLREFATILTLPEVRHMVGNSTGSNTHLAATVDLPAVSVDRGADEKIRANWGAQQCGPMGSFRWRNPHPSTAAFRLSWNNKTPENFGRVARLLKWHSDLFNQGWPVWNTITRPVLADMASRIIDGLISAFDADGDLYLWQMDMRQFANQLGDDQRAVYFDFLDEAEYFYAIGASQIGQLMDFLVSLRSVSPELESPAFNAVLTQTERDLMSNMFWSSNLAKLLKKMARHATTETPQGRASQSRRPSLWSNCNEPPMV